MIVAECRVCTNNARLAALPPRELVAADEYWRVAHAFGAALPGWLVLMPRRHITAVAELTDAEAASLGTWQVVLSRALHLVTGCVKTYVAQFAEAEGFSHVHFHVIPRPADLAADLRGPRIFELLRGTEGHHLSEMDRDELARTLQRHLGWTPAR